MTDFYTVKPFVGSPDEGGLYWHSDETKHGRLVATGKLRSLDKLAERLNLAVVVIADEPEEAGTPEAASRRDEGTAPLGPAALSFEFDDQQLSITLDVGGEAFHVGLIRGTAVELVEALVSHADLMADYEVVDDGAATAGVLTRSYDLTGGTIVGTRNDARAELDRRLSDVVDAESVARMAQQVMQPVSDELGGAAWTYERRWSALATSASLNSAGPVSALQRRADMLDTLLAVASRVFNGNAAVAGLVKVLMLQVVSISRMLKEQNDDGKVF